MTNCFLKCALTISLAFCLPLLSCTTPQTQKSQVVQTQALPVAQQDASQLYGELFVRAQLAPAYEDSKYFVDMVPRENPEFILNRFHKENPRRAPELRAFIERHFFPPANPVSNFKSPPNTPIDLHIKKLWKVLKRLPHEEDHPASSLISLPYPYVVPGGRFREIYYWDSYFTQLGLLADQEDELFKDMVKNFSHLLETMGRIPNGNRDYYRGRSQPPFFSHMVALWQSRFGNESAIQFLKVLKAEHDFWMKDAQGLNVGEAKARVVRIEERGILNRYWDDRPEPRPEAYKEDVALANKAFAALGRPSEDVYRDLRAGAESGWDYSTRWFSNPKEFATIQTTAFIPVDLNSLLYHLELKISELARLTGDQSASDYYLDLAHNRQRLIQRYLWDETSGTFRDFNWRTNSRSSEWTIAMVVPLFVGLATDDQAKRLAQVLRAKFLKAGGLITSLHESGQQWDAPNGWPPHQWMAFAGLKRYRQNTLAEQVRKRWLRLNQKVFRETGKMMEKYNVVDIAMKSGGGEYPLQDGFGWTNGVYRALTTPEKSLKHLIK